MSSWFASNGVLYTLVRSLSFSSSSSSSSTFSFALSTEDGLRAPLAPPAFPHALSSGLKSPFTSSSLRRLPRSAFDLFLRPHHPSAALLRGQRCEGLFKPVPRFSHLALDFGHSAPGRFSRGSPFASSTVWCVTDKCGIKEPHFIKYRVLRAVLCGEIIRGNTGAREENSDIRFENNRHDINQRNYVTHFNEIASFYLSFSFFLFFLFASHIRRHGWIPDSDEDDVSRMVRAIDPP